MGRVCVCPIKTGLTDLPTSLLIGSTSVPSSPQVHTLSSPFQDKTYSTWISLNTKVVKYKVVKYKFLYFIRQDLY